MNPHPPQNILSKGQIDPNNFLFYLYLFFGGNAFNKAGEIVRLGNAI